MMFSNPNLDIVVINANTKFGESCLLEIIKILYFEAVLR